MLGCILAKAKDPQPGMKKIGLVLHGKLEGSRLLLLNMESMPKEGLGQQRQQLLLGLIQQQATKTFAQSPGAHPFKYLLLLPSLPSLPNPCILRMQRRYG